MLDITLTLTASPELLSALSNFTNSITSAKVVTVPQSTPIYTTLKEALEQFNGEVACNQAASNTYAVQEPAVQAMIPTHQPVQTPPIPTSTQTYTMDQIAVAATQLMDAGRRQELISLLNKFGVQALTALPKEQYGAFATQLRGLGAKI